MHLIYHSSITLKTGDLQEKYPCSTLGYYNIKMFTALFGSELLNSSACAKHASNCNRRAFKDQLPSKQELATLSNLLCFDLVSSAFLLNCPVSRNFFSRKGVTNPGKVRREKRSVLKTRLWKTCWDFSKDSSQVVTGLPLCKDTLPLLVLLTLHSHLAAVIQAIDFLMITLICWPPACSWLSPAVQFIRLCHLAPMMFNWADDCFPSQWLLIGRSVGKVVQTEFCYTVLIPSLHHYSFCSL